MRQTDPGSLHADPIHRAVTSIVTSVRRSAAASQGRRWTKLTRAWPARSASRPIHPLWWPTVAYVSAVSWLSLL